MLTSLALVFLIGLSLAAICRKLRLPGILGMLVTGVVLGAYFNKSKAENTKGGIVYDAALGVSNSDTDL